LTDEEPLTAFASEPSRAHRMTCDMTRGASYRRRLGIQAPGVARLSALEMDQVRVDRRQHRRFPLASVEPSFSERNVVLLGAKLGDRDQRSKIGEGSNLNFLPGAELLDRGRERSEVSAVGRQQHHATKAPARRAMVSLLLDRSKGNGYAREDHV
jgi:hypothetical protein